MIYQEPYRELLTVVRLYIKWLRKRVNQLFGLDPHQFKFHKSQPQFV